MMSTPSFFKFSSSLVLDSEVPFEVKIAILSNLDLFLTISRVMGDPIKPVAPNIKSFLIVGDMLNKTSPESPSRRCWESSVVTRITIPIEAD